MLVRSSTIGGRLGLLDGRRRGIRGLRDHLDLVVLDHLFAAELLDGRFHELFEGRRRREGERALDEERVLGRDGLLDESDRRGPVAFVQDEEGALALLDLPGDLAHELLGDADVVEAMVQTGQDATRGTAHHGARGPCEDRPHHDPDPGAAATAVTRGLLDLDASPLGAVRERGVDDPDVVVHVVDLLDRLQEPPRGDIVVEDEHRQDLLWLLTHRTLLRRVGRPSRMARWPGGGLPYSQPARRSNACDRFDLRDFRYSDPASDEDEVDRTGGGQATTPGRDAIPSQYAACATFRHPVRRYNPERCCRAVVSLMPSS